MTYMIAIAGPAGSGKDALGRELSTLLERIYDTMPLVTAFAAPLRKIVGLMVGEDWSDPEIYAAGKDKAYPLFAFKTGRQLMIELTEEYLKPHYGRTIWADNLVQRITRHPKRFAIVTDLGFPYEAGTIQQAFPHCLIVQLSRPGKTYEGDSRCEVVHEGNTDVRMIRLHNPGTNPLQLVRLAGRIHDYMLNGLRWQLPGAAQLPLQIDEGD